MSCSTVSIPSFLYSSAFFGPTNIKTALSAVKREETLSAEILEKFGLLGVQEAMYKIHFPKSREEYTAARKRLVFEELLTLKLGLSMIRSRGRDMSGAVMSDANTDEFWSSLPFSPTALCTARPLRIC